MSKIDYVTTPTAARILNVSIRRVVAMINANQFKDLKKCECEAKSWLIPRKEIMRLLAVRKKNNENKTGEYKDGNR